MTTKISSDMEATDPAKNDGQLAKLNRSILNLSWMNLCLLVVWYLLYAEHQTGAWDDGLREFSGLYKIAILATVSVTLITWIGLAFTIWRRLKLG